jgi:hypothetical protein
LPKQALGGASRIVAGERGKAVQHRIGNAARELVRPASRRAGIGVDERMSDRFGGDESMRDDATKQILFAA